MSASPSGLKVKSWIWKYFIKGATSGICKICRGTVKTLGNTTNLKFHLHRHHKDIYELETNLKPDNRYKSISLPAQPPQSPSPTPLVNCVMLDSDEDDELMSISLKEDLEECQNDFEFESITATSTKGKANSSDITRYFKCVTPDSDRSSFSTPKNLKKTGSQSEYEIPVRSYTPQIDSCFTEIRSYDEGGGKSAKITDAILFMIAKDNLPLNTVEKEGCRYLLKVTAPLYKIPGRTKITSLVNEKYEILSNIVKQKMKNISFFTLTTDIWTETMNTQSFMGVTAHYLFEKKLCSTVIGVKPLHERHSAEIISENLLKICEDWNIHDNKIIAVVTDNAANMVKAVYDSFGKERHLPCFAHSLNLVCCKSLNDFSECKNLIVKVKDIVKFFTQSVVASDELKKIQNNTKLKLIQDTPTRWNSTYYMLDRFLMLNEKIGTLLLKFPKGPNMITALELATLSDVINVLKPLEMATKEISGEKYVTSSKIIPMVACITNGISEIVVQSDIAKKLKEKVITEMASRFKYIENTQLLAIPTLLDPRFKKIHFFDLVSCAKSIKVIDTFLKNEIKQNGIVKSQLQPQNTDIDESSIWGFHKQLAAACNSNNNNNSDVTEMHPGLNQYLASPTLDLLTNPLDYWDIRVQTHQELSHLATKYLTVVGTSVPSERLFSKAGIIMEESRNKLLPERLDKLLFLNSLQLKDWHIG